jgi:hypothetical protein
MAGYHNIPYAVRLSYNVEILHNLRVVQSIAHDLVRVFSYARQERTMCRRDTNVSSQVT